MHVNNLIIGQGIAGTFLSHALQKKGQSVLVIDEPRPFAASRVASGVINPVTGRRHVTTWMIDDLLPPKQQGIGELANDLGISFVQQKDVIDFFPSAQMRLAFLERLQEKSPFLTLDPDPADWLQYLRYDFDYGIIRPCYLMDVAALLQAFRRRLVQQDAIREDGFDISQLVAEAEHVIYQDVRADRILFCDGSPGAANPFFKNLPFAPNKGEALILSIPDLPRTHILKKGLTLVPWKEDLFWAGSSYEWTFVHDLPTEAFREKTEDQLKAFLRIPFTIVDHLASVRPATLERRPFVGFHPLHPSVGIFNGLGTKGCSLAPYFAAQLADHIVHGTPLLPEADVQRFRRVLSR